MRQFITKSLFLNFEMHLLQEALSANVVKSDVKTLYSDILKLSANDPSSSSNEEVERDIWSSF